MKKENGGTFYRQLSDDPMKMTMFFLSSNRLDEVSNHKNIKF